MYLRELKNERIAIGFNRLARVYSTLAGIVFGKTLLHAQEYFLPAVKAGDHILIVGGGSGDLLRSLLKQQTQIRVDYIDISEKMIQLAREKTKNPLIVNFIVGTELDIPNRAYSVVITNFYLDLFSDHTLQHVVRKIKTHLSFDGQWLVTDFVSNKNWHKTMLWMMYRFFRIVAGIEARTLPDWDRQLKQAGLAEVDLKIFFNGFIKSCYYRSQKFN